MMKKVSFLILAVCSLMLSSCGPKTTGMKSYDLDAVSVKRDLRLSELADDLRVVPLETGKDFLVSSTSNYWVNDKYILIFGDDAIEQFSAVDGKHIRTLAVQGGGPNEFIDIMSPVVDDAAQILYFTKFQGEELKRIDLNSGEFLPDSDLGAKVFSLAGITDDGRILLPSKNSLFEYFNPDTEEHDAFRKTEKKDSVFEGKKVTKGVTITTVGDAAYDFASNRHELFLQNKDTLFLIDGKKSTGYCSFVYKDEAGPGKTGLGGTKLGLEYVDNQSIIMSVIESILTIKQEGDDSYVFMDTHEKMSVIIDRKSKEASKIGDFIIDPSFEYKGKLLPSLFFRGSSVVSYVVEAYQLQECVEDALEKDNLSDAVKS